MSTLSILIADCQILPRVVYYMEYTQANFNFDIKMFSKQNNEKRMSKKTTGPTFKANTILLHVNRTDK